VLREFARRKPDNMGGIFEELLAKGRRVECFRFTEPWFDVGSFEAYLDATRALVGARMLMADGASFTESSTDGAVVVGKGSSVRNCTLRDTVVFEGCVLEDCVLERCIVDDGCRLLRADLTGKMLRKGTVLERKEPF
jgi:glucose-1-phosphate thymidylyltransferase